MNAGVRNQETQERNRDDKDDKGEFLQLICGLVGRLDRLEELQTELGRDLVTDERARRISEEQSKSPTRIQICLNRHWERSTDVHGFSNRHFRKEREEKRTSICTFAIY